MRKSAVVAAAAFVLGIGFALAADEIRDATVSDPDVHQVVLENEHVRVFEAMAAPGHKSPMHSHPPLVIVSLGTARARITGTDGKSQILTLRPGKVLWLVAAVMAVGALAGGGLGGYLAGRMQPDVLRWLVVGAGFGLAIYYWIR